MKLLSYYLVLSGFLGVITVLMTVFQSPVMLNFVYIFYILYMSSISLLIIYFGLNIIGEKAKIAHIGSFFIFFLSLFVFSFKGLQYSMVLGIGVIFSVIDFTSWVFNISFPISEFTIQYDVKGSNFEIGLNAVALLILICLLKNYKKISG